MIARSTHFATPIGRAAHLNRDEPERLRRGRASGGRILKLQRISRYQLLEEIGKGGMGVVYRARDEHLGRDVALKVLNAGSGSDESTRKRFRQEAHALSLLNHPGISTVFDFDNQNGTDFLVMEFVDGQRLEDLLRSGPLPESRLAEVGAQIAAALAAAHEQGVIHRDLKPGNVILTSRGQIKLLDFGLALLCPSAAAHTETRSVADSGPPRGDGSVHVPRADPGPGGGRAQRHLFAGGHPLRDGDGAKTVRRDGVDRAHERNLA